MGTVKVGLVGVGDISGIYLKNIHEVFHEIELVGICDLKREKAERAKEKYPNLKIYDSMGDIFRDPEIQVVLNLTRPYEHYGVTKAALEAGKHVYSEKPLAASFEEGRELAELAQAKGLMLGGAPDTFLGAGIQTCRRLIDDGYIGKPVGCAAFMIGCGHESWHPDPAFYYKRGGGPMLDMGPYYLTALVNLIGGVSQVTGMVKASFPTRTITSQPLAGTVVDVEVPTYVSGIMRFENGAIGTIFTTFDVQFPREQSRFIEVYGSEGTLFVPDPNEFSGPIRLYRPEDKQLRELPLMFGYQENSRALGLADMCHAILNGRAFRANWTQTLHVLEIMTAFEKSSDLGRTLNLGTKYTRGEPMVRGALKGIVE